MKPLPILYALLGLSLTLAACSKAEEEVTGPAPFEVEKKRGPVPPTHNEGKSVYYGVDVSHWQGHFMEEVKPDDSLTFAICKASQGLFEDPDFAFNWREIPEKGLIRGAYHFYDFFLDPVEQAHFFCNRIYDIKSTDIAPVLDIEQGKMPVGTGAEQVQQDALVFLRTVEKRLKRKPMIYTDYGFAQEYFNDPRIGDYDLWLAEYTSAPRPSLPSLWEHKGFKIWQRSDRHSINSQLLDFDIYYGDLEDLAK